jgi:hypothetical protein
MLKDIRECLMAHHGTEANCCEKEGIIISSLILRATGCKTLK